MSSTLDARMVEYLRETSTSTNQRMMYWVGAWRNLATEAMTQRRRLANMLQHVRPAFVCDVTCIDCDEASTCPTRQLLHNIDTLLAECALPVSSDEPEEH